MKPNEEVTESAKSTASAKPSETVKPARSARPTETTKPSETVKPARSAKPTGSAKPSETATPAESAGSEKEEGTDALDEVQKDNGIIQYRLELVEDSGQNQESILGNIAPQSGITVSDSEKDEETPTP